MGYVSIKDSLAHTNLINGYFKRKNRFLYVQSKTNSLFFYLFSNFPSPTSY